jgi:Bacterial low temperature requirement A protein (LtrA)
VAIAAAASPYGLALRDDSHAETTTSSGCAFTRYRPLTDNPVLRRLLESGQAFLIIALGESIVITGATASAGGLSFEGGIALACAFCITAALCWLYFK